MYSNGYIWRNSFIHRTNPLIKFVVFLLILVLIFLNTGFFVQMIILPISIFIFFLTKISFNVFKKVILTYLFVYLFLLIINWLTQKSPIFIDETTYNSYTHVGTNYFDFHDNKYAIAGKLLGGTVVTDSSDQQYALIFHSNKAVQAFLKSHSVDGLYNGYDISNVRFQDVHGGVVGYIVYTYAIPVASFINAFYVSNKLFVVILLSTVLTSSTSTIELTYALEDLLSPLKFFGLPVKEISMMISIAFRFIPSLVNETFRIMRSQASRGIDFKNGFFWDKARSLVSLLVPLFTISFIKADDLANAMTARAYNPRKIRSRYRSFSLHSADLIGFLFMMTIISLSFYYSTNNIYFTHLGLYEALALIGR